MATLPEVFAKIASVADGIGAAEVAGAARACAAADRPARALAIGWPSTPLAALLGWLERELPANVVAVADVDAPAIRWRSAAADRVLAVLPVGEFLDGQQCERLQELILARPAGTFRFVLCGMENVQPDAFSRSEAGLRHLLQPIRQAERTEDDAATHRFYYWMANTSEATLAGRLERDRKDLLGWLRQPLGDSVRQSLGQYQAGAMLESLQQRVGPVEASPLPEGRRLHALIEQMRHCRRRLLEIMERGITGLEREVTTSLTTLERDLLQDVRNRLRKHLHDAPHGVTKEQLRNTVSNHLREKLGAWSEQARATLLGRARELGQDSQVLLQGNDWGLLNDLCADRGLPERYPGQLLTALDMPPEALQRLIVLPGEVALPSDWSSRIPGGLSASSAPLVGALCGGALVAASALWLLPLGPMGALLGGGLGAVGGAYAGRQLLDPHAIDQAVVKVEQSIVHTAQQAMEAVNRFAHEVASQVRTSLAQQFERIESILNQARDGTAKPTDGNSSGYFAELAHLRAQLNEEKPIS